jgi:hypothetical protein
MAEISAMSGQIGTHRFLVLFLVLLNPQLCKSVDSTEITAARINFVFVLHKLLFVFVHAIRVCAVPELNFVHWHKRG